MAKTINSLKEHLDYIKKEFFNGNGLDGITEMSAEERVEFIKKNVDRLLENERNAMWLGDQFWTAVSLSLKRMERAQPEPAPSTSP